MKKLSVFFFAAITSVVFVNAQTLEWVVDDSTFNSGSGYVLALPHNEMYVVPNSNMGKGFSVFKYDANGTAIFQKNFSEPNSFSYWANNRIADAEENLFVEGTFVDSVYSSFLFLSKIDSNGNQLWQLLLPDAGFSSYSGQMILDDAGDIYFTATRQYSDEHSDMLVCKVSTGGSLLWSQSYGDSINEFRGETIVVLQDGNILVAGGEEDTYPYHGLLEVLKYTTDGNLLWHQEITDNSNGDDTGFPAVDLSVDHDGNIFVCGNARSLDLGMQRDYPYVAKLDSTGNKIWMQEIFDHGIILSGAYGFYLAGTLDNDGNYYAAGYDTLFHIVVVKFTSDGNVSWILNHLPMYNTSSGSINNIKVHDGYLFATGSLSDITNSNDYLVIAFDLSGNIQWTARYNSQSNDYNYLASLDFDNDDNVLVSGITEKAGTMDYYTTTIKYGNVLNDVHLISKDELNIQAFPNPANNDVIIASGGPAIKMRTLIISDECGVKVKEVACAGAMKSQIDIHDFSSGIYFFQVKTEDGQSFVGKFVKQ